MYKLSHVLGWLGGRSLAPLSAAAVPIGSSFASTAPARAEGALRPSLEEPPRLAAGMRERWPGWQFPDFELVEFRPRGTTYCVCVFVLNEGARIQDQLSRMRAYAGRIDIVVADGGSTDGALELDLLRRSHVRALLTKNGPGKLSAQMRMALAYALDQGYEGVVVVDGNGKDDISAIPEFIRLLDAGYDHIQGSRFITGGREVNTPLARLLAIRLLHAPLVSLAAHRRHTDTTNGFRAYSRRLLTDTRVAVFRDVFRSYELHCHLSIESSRERRFRVTETPVTRTYPARGAVPTKISPVAGNARFMVILLKAVAGRYRSGPARG